MSLQGEDTSGPQTREILCEDTAGDSLSMPGGEASGGPALLHLAVATSIHTGIIPAV